MSNPKNRNIPETLSVYFAVLLVYFLDIFILKSDRTILGDSLYSRLAGLVIVFGYIWIKKSTVSLVGVSRDREKIKTGLIFGTIFSIVPLILVIACECIYYGVTDISAIDIRFAPPNLNYIRVSEHLTPAVAILIYLVTSFVGSVFKEFFFRGFLLKKFRKSLSFNQANIFQSVLYMFMTMPLLLRNLTLHLYDDTTVSLGVFIVMFYIIHETLAGIKWGLITRVTGSTYVAVWDHFLFVFLSNSVFITNRYVTWSFMAHMLAIQVVSFIFVMLYYKVNMKKIEEITEADKKKETEEKRGKKDAVKKAGEKLDGVKEISPSQFKDMAGEDKAEPKHTGHHHSSSEADIPESFSGSEIDDFLRDFSEHGHHHADEPASSAADDEITDDFDADSFLESFQRRGGNSEPHRVHRRREEYVPPVEEFSDDTADSRHEEKPAEETKPEGEQPKAKASFLDRIFSLGKIDASDSNDLL